MVLILFTTLPCVPPLCPSPVSPPVSPPGNGWCIVHAVWTVWLFFWLVFKHLSLFFVLRTICYNRHLSSTVFSFLCTELSESMMMTAIILWTLMSSIQVFRTMVFNYLKRYEHNKSFHMMHFNMLKFCLFPKLRGRLFVEVDFNFTSTLSKTDTIGTGTNCPS